MVCRRPPLTCGAAGTPHEAPHEAPHSNREGSTFQRSWQGIVFTFQQADFHGSPSGIDPNAPSVSPSRGIYAGRWASARKQSFACTSCDARFQTDFKALLNVRKVTYLTHMLARTLRIINRTPHPREFGGLLVSAFGFVGDLGLARLPISWKPPLRGWRLSGSI